MSRGRFPPIRLFLFPSGQGTDGRWKNHAQLSKPTICVTAKSCAQGMAQVMPNHGRLSLSDILESHAEAVIADRVSLQQIVDALGHRSLGALLLVLALPMALPVPAPGLSVLFGLPMILIAAQLCLARPHAWLPKSLGDRSLSRADFRVLVQRMRPTLRRLERIVRPRATWLVGYWLRMLVGVVCLVLAVIITLPIPLGHVVPGTAICLLALGITEGDGLVVILGLIMAAAALIVVSLASLALVAALWP